MRFNSEQHLVTWKTGKRFPAIHDDIFHAILAYSKGKSFLDLCCSTGLLAQRIKQHLVYDVIGVDADETAVSLASLSGIDVPLICLNILPETLKELAQIIKKFKIDTLVARRCFPELFGNDIEFGQVFIELLSQLGVQEIFIEGRITTKTAINALASLEDECQLVSKHYKVIKIHKNVAYLRKI